MNSSKLKDITKEPMPGKEKVEPFYMRLKKNPLYRWARQDWFYIITIIGIFFLALFLRSYFYYDLAVDPPYPNYDYVLSGNDPYYHKQVIDHVQNTGGHLYWDNMLNFPVTARNPYPPVYDWSVAVTGMVLGGVTGMGTTDATWFVLLFAPAFWGAMIVFPVYFLTKHIWGKKAGIIAAFFMAIMPSHIERSPLGFSDHDAIVLFFVVLTFFFLAKSARALTDRKWVENWKSPKSITMGMKQFLLENRIAIGFALMCGFSIGTIALMWKGFPYVMVIISGYYIVQLVMNKFRRIDSLGLFVIIIIVNMTAMMISFPISYQLGAGTWYNPFYIVAGIVIFGFLFVPTRDYPWLIVLPAIGITVAAAYLLIGYFFPDQADALFSGGGYFIKSKLYSTIAEAQSPDLSRLVFSYGPVTFYLALIGLVLAIIAIPKNWSKDYTLIVIWCALAVYMAMSAVRFMFNASPVFAILTGWMVWLLFEKIDPTLRKFKRMEARVIYLYVGLVTSITLAGSLYITYVYVEEYSFFQYLFGLCALGIGMCLFGLYLTFRFNYYFTFILVGAYTAIFLGYTYWKMEDIFFVSLLLLAVVAIPLLVFTMFKYSASGVRIELTHIGMAVFIAFLILLPNGWFAVDSSIPYETKGDYDPGNQLLGAFGHSFVSEYWLDGMRWLSEQDQELPKEDRPGFVSWWDYGFWAIYLGQHPSVAENFQNGYHFAGSVIASQNETEAITLFSLRIVEADLVKTHGEKTRPILIKYLDPDNPDEYPKTAKIYDALIYPNKYRREVLDNEDIYGRYIELKPENTKYAIGRVIIMDSLTLDQKVNMLKELEDATGKCIRYFAVDSRLFPFTASNTGIFYAPIRLADRDIDDYLEYLAYAEYRLSSTSDEWIEYPDNPLTTERLEEEIDTRGQEMVRILNWELKYTDKFYNSMFYRTYIGWHGADVGLPDDAVPGISDGDQSTMVDTYPAMQAWNMTHFKLAYRTLYWNPHNSTVLQKDEQKYGKDWRAMSYDDGIALKEGLESDGLDNNNNGEVDESEEGGLLSEGPRSSVYYLKYFHGALVQGQIRTSPPEDDPAAPGRPVPDVRITVLDEYNIPHDVVYTDENGWYNITVPPGEISLWISKGGLGTTSDQDIRNSRLTLIETIPLNRTELTITEDQAMRRYGNYIVYQDMGIETGRVNGTIYWDRNSNDVFDSDETTVEDIELTLFDPAKRNHPNPEVAKGYSRTIKTDANGFYNFDQVIPGSYKLEAQLAGHNLTLSEEIKLDVADPATFAQMIPFGIKPGGIRGTVTYFNGSVAGDVTITLFDETNKRTTSFSTLANGTYRFPDLLPGNYSLVIEKLGFGKHTDRVLIEEALTNITDIVLRPVTPVSGNVWFDINNNGKLDADEKLPNARITFHNNEFPALTTVIFTDGDGNFKGNLTSGNYSAYIKYNMADKNYAGLEFVYIRSQLQPQTGISIEVEAASKVSGKITFLTNSDLAGALVRFIKHDDSSVVPFPTNETGNYIGYLPHGDYTLLIRHENFTVEYRYIKDFRLGSEPFELSTNLIHAWDVGGVIYWDRDGNDQFTSYWFDEPGADEHDHEHEDEEAGDTGGEDIIDHEHEDPALVKESLEDVILKFTSINGTYTARTNETGNYLVYLSPGLYTISLADDRFEDFPDDIPGSVLEVQVNMTAPDRPSHIIKDFELDPKPVTISGTVWFDLNNNGALDQAERLSGVKISLINLSYGADNYEATTDGSGNYKISVKPGVYRVEIDQQMTGGVRYSFLDDNFTVPFASKVITDAGGIKLNISLDKYIKVEYKVELSGTELTKEELTSENLTLHIYDSDENEIPLVPLPDIDLGGYLRPGEYSLWLDYFYQGDFYSFLGRHMVDTGKGDYDIQLVPAVRVNGTVYNDTGADGVDISDWLTDVEVKFRPDPSNGGLIKFNVSTGLYSVYMVPGLRYDVIINTTRSELIDNTEVSARYIYHDQVNINNNRSYDIEVLKYLSVSGLLFYNVFETDLSLSGEDPPGSGVVVDDRSIGKMIPDGRIIFTELSATGAPEEVFTTSNSSGRYEAYLRYGSTYRITILSQGFREVPKVGDTFMVYAVNTTRNIQADPTFVTLSGRLYSTVDNSTITGKVNLEFILYDDDEVGTIYRAVDIAAGHYSVNLVPEDYIVYGYTDPVKDETNRTNVIYRSKTYFGTVSLNISENKIFDVGMKPGVRVWGRVSYTDADDRTVFKIDQKKEDGEGLRVESPKTGGLKYLDISERGYESIYLPYGDYVFSSETRTREYDMNMTYELNEQVNIANTTTMLNFIMNKLADYRFGFELDRTDRTMTVSPGNDYKFKFNLKNMGNSKSPIKLESVKSDQSWDVVFDNSSLVLPINGEQMVTATVSVARDAYHDNTVDFKATSEMDTSETHSVVMIMTVPADRRFDFITTAPSVQGINYNETLEIKLSIKNLGNAGDGFNIQGSTVPPAWNVTIDERSLEQLRKEESDGLESFSYTQEEIYNNLTLRVRAPPEVSGHIVGERFTLDLFVRSKEGQKTDSVTLEFILNYPDLRVLDYTVDNLGLEEEGRLDITVNATVTSLLAGARNVRVGLFVDGIEVANQTMSQINESEEKNVLLTYAEASENKGKHAVEVVINPDLVIEEKDEYNNVLRKILTIGEPKEDEEFNWRPIYFMIALVIVFAGMMAYWRYRRRI